MVLVHINISAMFNRYIMLPPFIEIIVNIDIHVNYIHIYVT